MFIGQKPLPRSFRELSHYNKQSAHQHIQAHIRVWQDGAEGRLLPAQFMRDCLNFSPQERPKLGTLLSHNWLKGSENLAEEFIFCPPGLKVSHCLKSVPNSKHTSIHKHATSHFFVHRRLPLVLRLMPWSTDLMLLEQVSWMCIAMLPKMLVVTLQWCLRQRARRSWRLFRCPSIVGVATSRANGLGNAQPDMSTYG